MPASGGRALSVTSQGSPNHKKKRWITSKAAKAALVPAAAVIIAAIINLVGNVINAPESNAGNNAGQGTPSGSSASATLPSRAQSDADGPPYFFHADFRDSYIDGKFRWPEAGQPRATAKLSLQGRDASTPRAAQVRFQATDRSGQPIGRLESRSCKPDSNSICPEFDPVYFEGESQVVAITATVLLDGTTVARITCPRASKCTSS